jgi:hypothetical protein
MNCQNCNTRIDYLFLTNCAHCGCAVEPAGESQLQKLPQFQPIEPIEKRLTWKKRLVNLVYLFVSSAAGLITGTVVMYFTGAFVFNAVLAVFDPHPDPGEYCGLGSALGFLCIVGGAFLGTVGGSVFATKRPLCKDPLH